MLALVLIKNNKKMILLSLNKLMVNRKVSPSYEVYLLDFCATLALACPTKLALKFRKLLAYFFG